MCNEITFGKITIALALVISGCAVPRVGAAPGPLTAASVQLATTRWPTVTTESLEEGRQLFLAHCNFCHGYPDLQSYSEADLQRMVPDMNRRAGLSQENSNKVLQFVLATRSR